MFDPIEYILRTIGNIPYLFQGENRQFVAWFGFWSIPFFWCILRYDIIGYSQRKEEKVLSDICADLIDRIEKLMPIYEKTSNQYAEAICGALTKNENLVKLMQLLPSDIKERAEFDYCMHDADNLETVVPLQMQLQRLIEKEK
jgi:hypothetical protein